MGNQVAKCLRTDINDRTEEDDLNAAAADAATSNGNTYDAPDSGAAAGKNKVKAVACLVKAIRSLKIESVTASLDKSGTDIHARGADGQTGLFHALAILQDTHKTTSNSLLRGGNKARGIVMYMVTRGAGMYEKNGAADGWPLHSCSKMNEMDLVKHLLLNHAGELLMLNADKETACQIARRHQYSRLDEYLTNQEKQHLARIASGEFSGYLFGQLKRALAAGIHVNEVISVTPTGRDADAAGLVVAGEEPRTILLWAASACHEKAVRALIDHGGNVNAQVEKTGQSSLHLVLMSMLRTNDLGAAALSATSPNGREVHAKGLTVMKMLLDGAPKDAVSEQGGVYTKPKANKDMVKVSVVLANGQEVNVEVCSRDTVLDLKVALCLKVGIGASQQNMYGMESEEALEDDAVLRDTCADLNGTSFMVIVASGADPNIVDDKGRTPLHILLMVIKAGVLTHSNLEERGDQAYMLAGQRFISVGRNFSPAMIATLDVLLEKTDASIVDDKGRSAAQLLQSILEQEESAAGQLNRELISTLRKGV
jgi:hypothetical protein